MKKLTDLLKETGIELGKVYTDKDMPSFKTNEASIASWSDDKKTLRWKVYIDGEKKPLILTGRSASEVKKFAHQMINNNSVKIKKVVKEGKLDEVNVSSKPFQAWQEHTSNIHKLFRDANWAVKAIPHKKKEAREIQKLSQKLMNLVEIITGQAIDL